MLFVVKGTLYILVFSREQGTLLMEHRIFFMVTMEHRNDAFY